MNSIRSYRSDLQTIQHKCLKLKIVIKVMYINLSFTILLLSDEFHYPWIG